MALSVTHTFVSAIADDSTAAAAGAILPQAHWNAVHTLTGSASIAQGGTNNTSFTSGQVTYYDGSKLAGDAGLSYVSPGKLTLALGTITADADALTLTGTWNASGITFDAPLFVNITNTASAVASMLFDFQVGGTPLFILQPNTNAILSLADGTTASAFRVYNTVDTLANPVNYERFAIDWVTTANTLTIGTQKGGTGLQRDMFLVANKLKFTTLSSGSTCIFYVGNNDMNIASNTVLGFSGISDASDLGGNNDVKLQRVDTGVLSIFGYTGATPGFLQWGGQTRVTSDFSVTSSTTLVNVTGLSVAVRAGRTYHFEAELYVTDAAAGGVQAAIAGTATATAIQYTGYTIADNAIKGKTNATALATAVGSTVTTETSGIVVRVTGIITVNAAGTLTVQMAQNTSNGTATIAKRGSWLIVYDMP